MLDTHLIAKTRGQADARAMVQVGGLRVTVLTPRTIRVESGAYTDSATQAVWYRDLPLVPFRVEEGEGTVSVHTSAGTFTLDAATGDLLFCLRDGQKIAYDPADNRMGTARTLDQTNGSVQLEPGLIAKSGVSSMRDDTLLLGEDGMVKARAEGVDRYYFNSADPRAVLRDYYSLTGFPPLPPRFALGNWWSRYWAYSADEYLALLKRFGDEDVPFWVATIDMDWHWVNVLGKFGYVRLFRDKPYRWDLVSTFMPGWTGFSFNTDLFPDPPAFLQQIHDMGYHIPLNLHPADGVRWFENSYKAVCEAVGQDPAKKRAVPFDITSDAFLNAYFDKLLRPLEQAGVDFWWLDWQQGKKSKLPGYDPLWACNHYHTLDAAKQGKRPLILSRYAGIGSHRYPLGFSGDTYVTWKSLRFQPYFTANATNAGYPAWSHDIGGHMMGNQRDDELYLRWLQYGVFSPVLRLHSNNKAISKEPWNHKRVEEIAKRWLRFRHRLVPYLYSAMADTARQGVALIEPLYYRSAQPEAEQAPNEYWFGPELLVAPITEPSKKGVSRMKIWLPQGVWTDLFTDEVLEGGTHEVTRTLDSIPVFLKEGGILPLQDDVHEQGNPTAITVWAAAGKGQYVLYEDDNETEAYRYDEFHLTRLSSSVEGGAYCFTKHPGEGVAPLPTVRTWSLRLPVGYRGEVHATVEGVARQGVREGNVVRFDNIADADTLIITVRAG